MLSVRLIGICLLVVLILIAVGCSCRTTGSEDSSSTAIPLGSSESNGNSKDNSMADNQHEGSDAGTDGSNGSSSNQETPVQDASVIIGKWVYRVPTIAEDGFVWLGVLEFSADGVFSAVIAPENAGGDVWFDGNYTVTNGRILYDGEIKEFGLDGEVSILNSCSGTIIASIVGDKSLIIREDDSRDLFETVAIADVKYTKEQDQ